MARLIAWMNDERIGVLTKSGKGALSFQYESSWLNHPLARPLSLSLPLQIPAIFSPAVGNFFDNLLPDNSLIRKRISDNIQIKSCEPFAVLQKVGHDCVGAIRLFAPRQPLAVQRNTNPQTAISLERVPDDAGLRLALPGNQEKIALLKNDSGWCTASGAIATSHIIKFSEQGLSQPATLPENSHIVENEYLCMMLAKALGFNVANVSLIQAGQRRGLLVERFDRRWNSDKTRLIRLPQEDICQALGLSFSVKYQQQGGPGISEIMQLLMGSRCASEDRHNFMKFQVFQWLTGATCGHAKNFSLFIERGGSYRLTPFYDVISALPLTRGTWQQRRSLKLAMGMETSSGQEFAINNLFPQHFLATAKSVRFDPAEMQQILDFFVVRFPQAVAQVLEQLPDDFPLAVADAIFSHGMLLLERLRM